MVHRIARQIRCTTTKIEEDLGKAGKHDPAVGEQVQKDFEKLLEGMKSRQDQVVKDIDDIVKQIKTSNCNSGKQGSSDSNQNQKQSRKRDRNQSDQEVGQLARSEQAGGQRRRPGSSRRKRRAEQGKHSQKDQDPGENVEGDPGYRPGPEKAAHINLNEIGQAAA